ncbi:response regulator transcription factor [Paenibacillus polymyxa]|nr:response regulator transcription factor [Paenibacillus polymyxa]
MSQLRVLVIDDEWNMRNLLRIYLSNEGFHVTESSNGSEGLKAFRSQTHDVVLLDVMMPDMDGWQVCKKMREIAPVPILMLTARGEVKDKVLGLGIGADDYVVKPVDPEELIARIYALLRRSSHQAHAVVREQKLTFPDLTIYPERRQVVVLNENIDLTQKEYDILELLAQHPQRTFERDAIVERLWGNDFLGENRVIDTHIKNIREKLQFAELSYNPIKTVWGIGYKWDDSSY